MSVHRDKLASALRRAIQDVLGRGLADPRVRGFVSVTEVRLSADLADATVMVSVLPAEHEELTMHGLRAAASHVRSRVAKEIQMRRMPRLSFKLDRTIKTEARVLGAIREAIAEPDAGDAPAAEETP